MVLKIQRHPGGRPPKITAAIQHRIVAGLKAGNNLKASAHSAGITERTANRWLERGRTEKAGPFRSFRRAILRVRDALDEAWYEARRAEENPSETGK